MRLVFCNGSLVLHSSSVLEAGGLWWSRCRDTDIPPEDVIFSLPDYSINYEVVLVHELYKDSDNAENDDSVLQFQERGFQDEGSRCSSSFK